MLGVGGSGNDQFSSPQGITTDGTFLYITDMYNHRVVKRWASNLSYVAKTGIFGKGINEFSYPQELNYNNGFLYITDSNNHRLVRLRASDLGFVEEFSRYSAKLNSSAALGTGLYKHVAVLFERVPPNMVISIYINGTLDSSSTVYGYSHIYNMEPFQIGYVSNYLGGEVDELKIYDRLLTPEEINSRSINSVTVQPGAISSFIHTCTSGMCNYNIVASGSVKQTMASC
jgi:hypothetical protein